MGTEYDQLFSPGDEPFHVMVSDASSFANLYMQIVRQYPEAVIRRVRGGKARTRQGMFDEIGAALQFPYYFGENWAALWDCLSDLDWAPGSAYVLMVGDAHLLLAEEDPEVLASLMRILRQAHDAWEQPVGGNPGTPFRVLMQCPPEAAEGFRQRLAAAGIVPGS